MRQRSSWSMATVGVAIAISAVTAFAQFPRERPALPGQQRIVSGSDVGFRIDGTDLRTGGPTGVWVIKVNGNWVEAESMGGVRPAK